MFLQCHIRKEIVASVNVSCETIKNSSRSAAVEIKFVCLSLLATKFCFILINSHRMSTTLYIYAQQLVFPSSTNISKRKKMFLAVRQNDEMDVNDAFWDSRVVEFFGEFSFRFSTVSRFNYHLPLHSFSLFPSHRRAFPFHNETASQKRRRKKNGLQESKNETKKI